MGTPWIWGRKPLVAACINSFNPFLVQGKFWMGCGLPPYQSFGGKWNRFIFGKHFFWATLRARGTFPLTFIGHLLIWNCLRVVGVLAKSPFRIIQLRCWSTIRFLGAICSTHFLEGNPPGPEKCSPQLYRGVQRCRTGEGDFGKDHGHARNG